MNKELFVKFMKRNDDTQTSLAEAMGMTQSAINKYETGIVVNLKKSTLSSLARALNVSPIDLLSPEDSDLSGDEQFILDVFRSLSPRGKELLRDRCEELKLLYGKKPESNTAESV